LGGCGHFFYIPMRLVIRSPSDSFVCEIESSQITVYQLKEQIREKSRYLLSFSLRLFTLVDPRWTPARQRLSIQQQQDSKRIILEDNQTLQSYDIKDNSVIYVKDLGLQVSWKLVFFLEYLGPLVIVPLLSLQPSLIYSSRSKTLGTEQKYIRAALSVISSFQLLSLRIAVAAWVFHYAKRELETFFVHRFSHSTMPWKNLVKNCFYYWGFAFWIGYFLCHPLYTPPPHGGRWPWFFYLGLGIFVLAELANGVTHWMLRQLRPPGSKVRKIPRGFLFDYVTCPNYTCEIVAWLGFNVMSQTLLGWLFMLVGAIQMTLWARKKHRQYLSEFDGKDQKPLYPRNRKILVPFIY